MYNMKFNTSNEIHTYNWNHCNYIECCLDPNRLGLVISSVERFSQKFTNVEVEN